MSSNKMVNGKWLMVNGRSKEFGQSLVEVLVVMAVAAIMLTSLVVVIISSLKNAQFAQNQTKATKLAQDSIDKIRYIRDVDDSASLRNGGSHSFSYLWDPANTTICANPTCYIKFIAGTDYKALIEIAPTDKDDLGNGLSRQIYMDNKITTSGNESINLTVKIIWSDSSGTHESNLQTVLTKL